ncbi:MAG: hypothetical protein QXH80_01455 [Candidatus Nanoarchaeia archaeon]
MDLLASIFLAISFLLTLKLKMLMGEGEDTAPVQLLLMVIFINFILGITLLIAVYQKYIGAYVNYIRLTDFMMLVIGVVLLVSVTKIYRNYAKLIKKHEPNK